MTLEEFKSIDADDNRLIGLKVVRGPDWCDDNQDCDKNGNRLTGNILSCSRSGLVYVRWEQTGYTYIYRHGSSGRYELQPANIQSNEKLNKKISLYELALKNTSVATEDAINAKDERMYKIALNIKTHIKEYVEEMHMLYFKLDREYFNISVDCFNDKDVNTILRYITSDCDFEYSIHEEYVQIKMV